jgi:hypothetical protein
MFYLKLEGTATLGRHVFATACRWRHVISRRLARAAMQSEARERLAQEWGVGSWIFQFLISNQSMKNSLQATDHPAQSIDYQQNLLKKRREIPLFATRRPKNVLRKMPGRCVRNDEWTRL